jgi:hypothetical protein
VQILFKNLIKKGHQSHKIWRKLFMSLFSLFSFCVLISPLLFCWTLLWTSTLQRSVDNHSAQNMEIGDTRLGIALGMAAPIAGAVAAAASAVGMIGAPICEMLQTFESIPSP